MNRYTVIGFLNFLVGGFLFVISLVTLVFILPKITSFYSAMNADVTKNMLTAYLSITIQIFMGTINIFLGTRMFSKNSSIRTRSLKKAIIILFVTFLLIGFLTAITTLSTILPIYNLTNNF